MKISSLLDDLSVQCRSYLADKHLPTTPLEFNRDEDVLCRMSTSICDFLWEYGFKAAERELRTDLGSTLITAYRRLSIQRLQHAIPPPIPHHAQGHDPNLTCIHFHMSRSPPGIKSGSHRFSRKSASYRLIPRTCCTRYHRGCLWFSKQCHTITSRRYPSFAPARRHRARARHAFHPAGQHGFHGYSCI